MWAFWMKARLMKKGLWEVVDSDPIADEKQEECDAFHLLITTISEWILSRVIDATSARNVWQKLRKLYASRNATLVVAIEEWDPPL